MKNLYNLCAAIGFLVLGAIFCAMIWFVAEQEGIADRIRNYREEQRIERKFKEWIRENREKLQKAVDDGRIR